jgi:hypothetical protein
LQNANELVNVIEEDDPNGKNSSEVCRDIRKKESVWYSMIYEEGYISTEVGQILHQILNPLLYSTEQAYTLQTHNHI